MEQGSFTSFSVIASIPAANICIMCADATIAGTTAYTTIPMSQASGSVGVHDTGHATATGAHIICMQPQRDIPQRHAIAQLPVAKQSPTDKAVYTGQYICDNCLGAYTQSVCIDTRKSLLVEDLLQLCVTDPAAKDFNCNGQLYNSWQGDYSIRQRALGAAGLFVGRYIMGIEQDKFCSIILSAVDDSLNAVFMNYSVVTPHTLHIYHKGLQIKCSTPCALQALGIISNEALSVQDSKAYLQGTASQSAIKPVYRIQQLQGQIVSGRQVQVVMPSAKSENSGLLYKQHLSYAGSHLQLSKGALITAIVPKIQSIIYDNNNQTYTQQQLKEIEDAGHKEALDLTELTPQQLQQHRTMLRQLQLCDFSQLKKTYASFYGHNKHITYMGQPQSMPSKDPYTQQQVRVSKVLSFISQQDDGSIILRDGHGSEIRMIGGDIIISPARDLRLRPGQGLQQIVPGTAVLTAQDIVTTSRDTTTIGSGKDMSILPGLTKGDLYVEVHNGGANINASTEIAVDSSSLKVRCTRCYTWAVCHVLTGGQITINAQTTLTQIAAGSCVRLNSQAMSIYAPDISTACGINMQDIIDTPRIQYFDMNKQTGAVQRKYKTINKGTNCRLRVGDIQCTNITAYGSVSAAKTVQGLYVASSNARVGMTRQSKAPVQDKSNQYLKTDNITLPISQFTTDFYTPLDPIVNLPEKYQGISISASADLFAWQRMQNTKQALRLEPLVYKHQEGSYSQYPGLDALNSITLSILQRQDKDGKIRYETVPYKSGYIIYNNKNKEGAK